HRHRPGRHAAAGVGGPRGAVPGRRVPRRRPRRPHLGPAEGRGGAPAGGRRARRPDGAQARLLQMIELHEVTKKYGPKTAVDRRSLRVEPGELFAFLGPNGAGKTTTIKLLCGLLFPTAGTVRVGGYDLQSEGDEARQLLSYVPDQPYLYEKLTGREFLQFIADMYRM